MLIFQGIPDLTVREYDGDCFLEWVEPNSILQPSISITARVAKILLASKKQPDLYQGNTGHFPGSESSFDFG